MILPVLAQVVAAPIAGRMLDKDGARKPASLGAALMIVGLVFLAFGFLAGGLVLILIGTILGGADFSFMNPVQMAALSETPLAHRRMLAGIFPLASNFGTALFVRLLTAGLSALMDNYMASNPGATEATAQPSALGTLAWISAAATLVTLVISLMLRKPAQSADALAAPVTAKPAIGK